MCCAVSHENVIESNGSYSSRQHFPIKELDHQVTSYKYNVINY